VSDCHYWPPTPTLPPHRAAQVAADIDRHRAAAAQAWATARSEAEGLPEEYAERLLTRCRQNWGTEPGTEPAGRRLAAELKVPERIDPDEGEPASAVAVRLAGLVGQTTA